MQPRVTAILVARNGAGYLERTLGGLRAQTRRPDATVFVDAGSSDSTSGLLAAAAPTQLVAGTARGGFGSAVAQGVHVGAPLESPDDWIWLLGADSAPHPRALETLLAAVEVAPSVAIAGPKIMRWDRDDTIARYGESMTRLGASVFLVEDELDQAQYDAESDLLAVSAQGMLVRRSVWGALGGFDPGLPSVDAALDFSVRARLAGHRVIGVPAARVSAAGGPELFGRTSLAATTVLRLRRRAQLHRRMVYARGLAVLINWLALLPIGIVRAAMQLVRKQPGAVAGELGAALATAFSSAVGPARRNLRRTRKVRWSAIAPLRVSSSIARDRHAGRILPVEDVDDAPPRARASFLSGGVAVVIIAAAVGAITFIPLLGAASIKGGALVPLSSSIGQLWANVGYSWHDVGGGFVGASDPFAAVLAVLGSLTFWSPQLSVVCLYLLALPLAALGAWWAATRITDRTWPPAVAALLWAFAPPFLTSMMSGHLAAVIVHLLLPWFAYATLGAARSWSAGAAATLLFAGIAASSPSLVPVLVLLLLAWLVAKPRATVRIIGILIPAAALFAPLVVAQFARGNPLALLADPGVPTPSTQPGVAGLVLGSPDASLAGWSRVGALFSLPALPGVVVLAILVAPLIILAFVAPFLPGTRRSVPAVVVALLGFATAVVVTGLSFEITAATAVTIWPGPALSLMWLGLVGAATVTLERLGRGVVAPALVTVVAAVLAGLPLVAQPLAGTSKVVASSGTLAPAFVTAEAVTRPRLGTLVLTPERDGSLAAQVERGAGETLDAQSTLASTSRSNGFTKNERDIATLAGNLASRSGFDTATTLSSQKIGFVLLAPSTSDSTGDAHQRAADALDGNQALTPVGDTTLGLLWRYGGLPRAGLADAAPDPGILRLLVLVGLGIVFFITLLFAVPTRGRRRRSRVRPGVAERATLGEDDDA